MDDSQISLVAPKKSHPIIDDSHVIDADVFEEDINPSIFEESAQDDVAVDSFGRTMGKDEAEQIKDRLNESFTEQFGTAAYSSELKKKPASLPVPVVSNQAQVAAIPAEQKKKIKELFAGVDVENLAKGLDVLQQVKDLKHNEEHDKEEEDLEADYFDDFDEGDNSLQGMHFVAQDEDQDFDDELDFNGSESKNKERASSSTALARSAGNIGAFIRAANMVPMLTEEEERTLAKRLREFGDVDAARRLVTSHLRFVVSVARKFTGYGLPLADLIQEGNIGLMKAVKNYDPDVGHGLAAFASSWIKAEMFDYVIRNWRMVKVATTKAQRKLFFNLRKSKKRLGWMSDQERSELAHDLGVSKSDVAEMESRLAGSDVGFDLDESDNSDKSVAVTLSPASYLEDENSNFAQNYENSNYAAWEVKKLREALASLDNRSRHIIKRRWLDENKATLQELSKELNVSIERVRQLENNAMNKVKAILLNEGVKGEEGVLALEHHDKAVAQARKKRVSGKGASERLKALPLKNKSEPVKRGRKRKVVLDPTTVSASLSEEDNEVNQG